MAETTSPELADVSIEQLTKQFEDVTAVSEFDLQIEPGELLVLLGPSGCGKTTTLRMVAGLEQATSGTIRFGDDDVTGVSPQRRDVSMVFQNYALYPHETVRGNFAFPLRKTDLDDTERERRIERVAGLLDIEHLLDTKPAQLSGGQRQRVAVGRALVRQPRVLCMDEPLSNLDAKLRVDTRAELRKLQQELDITTIYVTHDQEEAMSIADRIAVMNAGRIAQVGTPREVYEEPVNQFVASFVGDPPMNFLDAAAVDRSDLDVSSETLDGATTVGIRPEYVYGADEAGDPIVTNDYVDVDRPSNPLSFDVRLVEPVGRAYEVQLRRGPLELAARLRTLPEHVQEGERAWFVVDVAKIAAFDETGEVA